MANAALPDGIDGELLLRGVAPLESAGPGDLAYMDNPAYGSALAATRAAACLVTPRFAAKVPTHTVAIVTPLAYRVFAQVLAPPVPVRDAAGILLRRSGNLAGLLRPSHRPGWNTGSGSIRAPSSARMRKSDPAP